MQLLWLTSQLLIFGTDALSESKTVTTGLCPTRTRPFRPSGSEPDLEALRYVGQDPVWLQQDNHQAVITVNIRGHGVKPVSEYIGRDASVPTPKPAGDKSDKFNVEAQTSKQQITFRSSAVAQQRMSIIPASTHLPAADNPEQTDAVATVKSGTSRTVVMVIDRPKHVIPTATKLAPPSKTPFLSQSPPPPALIVLQDVTSTCCATTRPLPAMRRHLEPDCPQTMPPGATSTPYRNVAWNQLTR